MIKNEFPSASASLATASAKMRESIPNNDSDENRVDIDGETDREQQGDV